MKQVRTSKDSHERFTVVNDKVEAIKGTISLIPNETFQEMIGFGAAFTESAAYTFSRMSADKQEEVLEKYFGQDGLNYTIGRVHIHSCDFSLENYTYINDYDTTLRTFDMSREDQWVIPFLQRAEEKSGRKIELLASPWSPPAWMKSNNDMNHGGTLLDEYKEVWANYYVRYLEEAKSKGLNIFAITVQNEPAAVQIWDSCIYTAEQERDFVKNYLGPAIEKSSVADTKIIIWDHNRDILVERATTVLEDPEASKYVWGTGLHWYVSEEFNNLSIVHNQFPDKHLLFTEGCQEGGVHLGSWLTGERYARNMIGDFNNYCEGYLDWNIILDETGGPNHVGNLCDAPIICDTVTDDIHINSSYYYIGHFSKYVMPGAKRIKQEVNIEGINTVSFKNPNNQIVTIILNETEENIGIELRLDKLLHKVNATPRSISTVVWED